MAQYTIQSGDTLSKLAQTYKTDIPTLQKLNPQIKDPNLIYAGAELNLPTQPTAPTPTLTAEQLSTTPTPKLPEKVEDTTDYKSLDKSVKVPEIPKEKTPLETKQEEASGIIARAKALMGITAGKEAFEAEQRAAQGYAEKQAQIEDISAQIEALDVQAEAEKLSMREGGVPEPIIQRRQAGVSRENTIKKLNLSASLLAAQGKFNAAKLRIDQAVNAKYAKDEAELKNKITQLEFITKYELTPLETKRKEELLAQAKTDAETLAVKKAQELEFNKNIVDAQQGGMKQPETDRARALFKAGSIDEANAVIAPYSSKVEKMDIERERLELAQEKAKRDVDDGIVSGVATRDADSVMAGTVNLQDLPTKDGYRAKVSRELTTRFETAKKTGDIYGTMRASAVYDKEPGDAFLISMEKTIAVLSQIGVLQQNIEGENTGPLVGAFREKNPWDTKAQTIKAQLNAIVPNLARGVYGEVGVLTDNDIKQYSKTLPTLTSTKEIRDAILYITVDQIRKNVEIKIKNQAAGQRDMSGYADIYTNLTQEANNILKSIPGGGQQDLPFISNEEFLQTIPATRPTTSAQTDNKSFFRNIYNQIIGK